MISYRNFFITEAPTDSEESLRQRLVGINQYYYHKADVQDIGGKRVIKTGAVPAYVRNKNGKLEKFNPKIHHNPNAAPSPAGDQSSDKTQQPTQPEQKYKPLTRADINRFRNQLFTGENPPIGTAGSAVGETFGIICAEQSISGVLDKFFKGHRQQIIDKVNKLNSIKGATRTSIQRYLQKHAITIEDLAKQEVWIDEQYKMLSQYKQNKKALINKLGETEAKEWLRVAYRTGINEAKALKGTPEAHFSEQQDAGFPLGIVVNAEGRQQIIQHLRSQFESNRPHYQRQLDILNHLEDTDSAILYKDSEGNYRVWHISNKKTFEDPHVNTYPNAKFEMMKSRVNEVLGNIPDRESVLADLIQISNDIGEKIHAASQGFGYVGEFLWKNAKTPAQKKQLITSTAVLLRELPDQVITKRRDGIEKILKRNGSIKKFVAAYEKQTGKKATDLVYAEGLYKLLGGELTTKSGGVLKPSSEIFAAISKISALVDAARDLAKDGHNASKISARLKISERAAKIAMDSGGLYKRLYGVASDFKDQSAAIHGAAVSAIQKRDMMWKRKHLSALSDRSNGPASQLYVDSYLKTMHWYDYISGQLDGVKSINIGGKSVSPKNFRECVKNLSRYPGELKTDEDRKRFGQFLRERIRISSVPGDAHISFDSDGHSTGPVRIGKEIYRAKGQLTPILGYLGKDMIGCLDK